MALAAALLASMPVWSRRVADTWATRLGFSLFWGFVALVCIPVAALILIVSLVGIPIGLLAMLLYAALLLVGDVASGIALGQWGLARWRAGALDHRGWRIGSALGAVLLLALLGSLPYIGGLVIVAATVAGIGAILQALARRGPSGGPEHLSA